jgi:hypothetical protein
MRAPRLFTLIHSHRHGYAQYVFTVKLPTTYPSNWTPSSGDLDKIIKQLGIDFEPEREEWIEIECQGGPDKIRTVNLQGDQ